MIGKIFREFSNDWKKSFQWLEKSGRAADEGSGQGVGTEGMAGCGLLSRIGAVLRGAGGISGAVIKQLGRLEGVSSGLMEIFFIRKMWGMVVVDGGRCCCLSFFLGGRR